MIRTWLAWAWYRVRYPHFCFHCDRPTFRRHDHRLSREAYEALTEAVRTRHERKDGRT